jgi:hypothetical protein
VSAAELAGFIGREALADLEPRGLRVRVRIIDARHVFGRIDARIEPTDGEGSAWVSLDRLEVTP